MMYVSAECPCAEQAKKEDDMYGMLFVKDNFQTK